MPDEDGSIYDTMFDAEVDSALDDVLKEELPEFPRTDEDAGATTAGSLPASPKPAELFGKCYSKGDTSKKDDPPKGELSKDEAHKNEPHKKEPRKLRASAAAPPAVGCIGAGLPIVGAPAAPAAISRPRRSTAKYA